MLLNPLKYQNGRRREGEVDLWSGQQGFERGAGGVVRGCLEVLKGVGVILLEIEPFEHKQDGSDCIDGWGGGIKDKVGGLSKQRC